MSGRGGPKPGGSFQKIQKTLTTVQKAAAGCQIDSELHECLVNFKATAIREPDVAARLVAEAHGLPFLVAKHAREFANGAARGASGVAASAAASGWTADMSVHWGIVEAAAHVVAAATHASPFEGRSAADVSHGHKAVSSLQWRQWFRAVLEAAVLGIQSSGVLQRLDAAEAAGSAAAAGAGRPPDVPTPDQLRLSSTLAALVALCGKLSRQPPALGRGAWRKPLQACVKAAASALHSASSGAGAGQPVCGAWLAESRITDDDGGDDDDEGAGDDDDEDDDEEEEDDEAEDAAAGASAGSGRKGAGHRGTGGGAAVQPSLPLLHSLLTSNTVAWLRTPPAAAAGTAGSKTSHTAVATLQHAGCIADTVHAQLAVVTRYLQAAMVAHGPDLRPVELAGPALLRLNILQAETAGLCSASSLSTVHSPPAAAIAEDSASLLTARNTQVQQQQRQQRTVALLLQSVALQRIGAGVTWALLTAVHLCRRLPASQALLEILLSEARAGVEYLTYAAYRQTASALAASDSDVGAGAPHAASVGGADAAVRTGLQHLLGAVSDVVFAFVPPLVATTKAWLAAVLFAASRKSSDAAAGHTRRKASHKAGAGSAGAGAAASGADTDGTPTASASAPGSVVGDDKFHDAYFVTSGVSPASGREVANEVQAAADGILAAAAHAAAAACLRQRAPLVDGTSAGASAAHAALAVVASAAAALLDTVSAPTHTTAPQFPAGTCADAKVSGTAVAAHALRPTAAVLCWPWHKTAARYGSAAAAEAAPGHTAGAAAATAAAPSAKRSAAVDAAVTADALDPRCSPEHLLALLAAPDARVPQLLLRACAWGICAQSASSGPESAAAHVIAPPEVVTALHAVVPALLAASDSSRAPSAALASPAGSPAPAGEDGSDAALLTHEASLATASRAATAKSPAFLSHALDAVVAATSAAVCFHGAATPASHADDAARVSLSPLLRAVWRPLAAALPQGHRYSAGMQKVVLSSVKRVLAAGDTLLRALQAQAGSGPATSSDASAAGSSQAAGAIAAELSAVLQPAEAARALLAYVQAARVELVPALARAGRARQSTTLSVLLQLQAGAAGPAAVEDGLAPHASLLPAAAPAALHADAANLLLEAAAQAAGLALRMDSVLMASPAAPADGDAATGGDAALVATRDVAASPAITVMAALSDAVADGLRILRLKESSAGLPPLQVLQATGPASTPAAAATSDTAADAASVSAEVATIPAQPAVAPVRKRGVRFAGAEEEDGSEEVSSGPAADPSNPTYSASGAVAPGVGLGGMDEEAEGEVETLGHFTASAAALLTALLRRLPAAAPTAALSAAAGGATAEAQQSRHLRAACAAVLRPVVARAAAEPVVFDEDGLLDSLGADLLAAL